MAEKSNSTSDADDKSQIKVSGWSDDKAKVHRRTFPGPKHADVPMRISMSRQAYADVTSHAKESLKAEICGVLVGDVCEDGEGRFLCVEGIIRGSGAREGSTHVTFTQETWNKIHEEKEKHHRKRQIVGWYHTHPGFGVEFSEMDLFIQRNFFSGPGQFAYVTDPLGGQEAILANSGGSVVPVLKFWVDGREKRCQPPAGAEETSAPGGGVSSIAVDKTLKSVEERLSQVMAAVESQQVSQQRFLLTLGMLVAMVVVYYIASAIISGFREPSKPPEVNSFVPVPIQVGDKSMLMGVAVVKWEVPKELNAAYVELERQKQLEEEKRAREKRSSTAPSTQPGGQNKGKTP